MATTPPQPQTSSKTGIRSKAVWVAALGGFITLLSPLFTDTVQQWESGPKARVLVVYKDKLAADLPTVCNGLTKHVTNTPIVVGERWTEEKCIVEESNAMERVQRALLPCFKVLPPKSVFDMASSHAWNLGASATCGSGAMQAFNRGEWQRGCDRISRGDDGRLVWSFTSHIDKKTGKKVMVFVQGLANRRADETVKCGGDL